MNRYDDTDNGAKGVDRKNMSILIVLCVVGGLVFMRSFMGGPSTSAAQSGKHSSESVTAGTTTQDAPLVRVVVSPVTQRPVESIRNLFAFNPLDFMQNKATTPLTAQGWPYANEADNADVIAGLKVQGTTQGEQVVALINGNLYRVGDRINSRCVLRKIDTRSITVEVNGQEIKIEF